jgi:hypothetical protein
MFLKDDDGRSLEINMNGRFDDEGWAVAEIRVRIPGFSAHYATFVYVEDFRCFYNQLVQLKNNTSKNVEFITSEDGLHLNCELQSTGRLDCNGRAKNDAGSVLEFYMSVENQAIDNLLLQLERLLKDYPVIGEP